MLGKILGAFVGEKIAGRNSGIKGAALGYGAAALARRGLGPLGLGLGLAWGAKKLWDLRQARQPSYPSDATPSSR